MPSYPISIPCCNHIKADGIQCGSPALRQQRFCYYHQPRPRSLKREPAKVTWLPLADASSIQMALVDVMKLMVTHKVDHNTARLMLYALRMASSNLRETSFQPELLIQ